jgi:tetratricopeptide (TPR) repeat protein
MVYLFAFLLVLAALPARGAENDKPPKGNTGAASATVTGVPEKIDEEIIKAKEAVRAEPSDSSAHVRLAYLLLKNGALDEAMKLFDEALRINPRSYDAKTGRGIVLARKGNRKEAEQVLKDALILNPNPVRTHYELGLLYQQLHEYDKAAAEFKEGIEKHEQGRM